MARVQLALNVSDVDAAVEFYSRLFGVAPAKRRPGYANFAIDEPALKLVLIENRDAPATLNHLGVEVGTAGDVAAARARLAGEGLETATEENVSCCYARQDKVWVSDPDGAPWEIYTDLGHGRHGGRIDGRGGLGATGPGEGGVAGQVVEPPERHLGPSGVVDAHEQHDRGRVAVPVVDPGQGLEPVPGQPFGGVAERRLVVRPRGEPFVAVGDEPRDRPAVPQAGELRGESLDGRGQGRVVGVAQVDHCA